MCSQIVFFTLTILIFILFSVYRTILFLLDSWLSCGCENGIIQAAPSVGPNSLTEKGIVPKDPLPFDLGPNWDDWSGGHKP